MREGLAPISANMLRETLQRRTAGVPGEHRATRAVRNKGWKIAKLQRALIENVDVLCPPQEGASGRNLVGSQLPVTPKPSVSHERQNHRSVVRGVQISR